MREVEKEQDFLKYHEENPGKIEPRVLTVEYSVFTHPHGISTERCPTCGQNRQVSKTSARLAIVPEGHKRGFTIDQEVWQAAGIKTSLEPGTMVELEIGVEQLVPCGFVEKVTRIEILK